MGSLQRGRGLRSDRRRGVRILLAVLIGFAVVILIAAIGLFGVFVYGQVNAPNPVKPPRSMVVGSWRNSSGVMIKVNFDGTFSERGLPGGAGEDSISNIPKEGKGRWRVHSSEIIFEFYSGEEMDWLMERDESTVYMYYDISDPNSPVDQFALTRA